MAKDHTNQGGPTHNPKDEPSGPRNVKKIQSADERTNKRTHGGSDKGPRG